MKVLFIGSDRSIFEEDSSSRKRMMDYANHFDELHIIVFSTKKDSLQKTSISNLYLYPTSSRSRWLYVFDAIKLIKNLFKKKSIDVISSQDPFEAGLVGLFGKRTLGCKYHIQIHTDIFSPYFLKNSKLNSLRRIMGFVTLPQADGIRVVSKHIKHHLLKKYKNFENVISILPIFVDVEKIRNTEPEFDLHERFPEFSHIILMVGRLEGEKNVETAIDVMSGVLKKYSEAGLVIVGDGSQRKSLEEYVKQKRISSNVVFEGHKGDVASYFKTADIFLHTALFEGFGRIFVEAYAANTPIVSSDVGLLKSIAPNEKKSFVCRPMDKKCYARKIRRTFEKELGDAPESLAQEVDQLIFRSYGEYLDRFYKTYADLIK